MDISEWCHAWNRGGGVLANALSSSTRRRKPLARSYGENDSSPWTPVAPVLTNTSQLMHITHGPLDNLEGTQPVADTGWPVKSEHAIMQHLQVLERIQRGSQRSQGSREGREERQQLESKSSVSELHNKMYYVRRHTLLNWKPRLYYNMMDSGVSWG